MPKTIFTSLSPNTQPDDLIVAMKTLLNPLSWKKNRWIKTVEQQVSQRLNNQPVVMTSSGRASIYWILKGYGIGKGDEVIIQAFTCLAVPAPILWTGAKPVYADILPDTYNIDPDEVRKNITPRTKAIFVQHTFGIPGPVSELKAIAKEHNLVLIEDLAHAFSGKYNNKPLGTHADAAIMSFGRDKTFSSVFAGAITSRDEDVIKRIRTMQSGLPLPPAWWVAQQLLHPILMSVIMPTYFVAGFGKVMLVAAQKIKLLSMAVASDEKRGLKPRFIDWQLSPGLAQLLSNQLQKFDKFTEHRKHIVNQYIKNLPATFQHHEYADMPLLRYPLLVSNRDQLLQQALSERMMLGDWYAEPVRPSPTTSKNPSEYVSGSCPVAEKTVRFAINLPTHQNIKDSDVVRISDLIKKHAETNF